MRTNYVHGYSDFESERLADQAKTLSELLHFDSYFPPGSHILEIGCGVGAQTEILCQKNPHANFTSVDISDESLRIAKLRCNRSGFKNVSFIRADVYNLPFRSQSFDHIFICFFLEHLPDTDLALHILKDLIRPGGSITVIEGDHGSAYYSPESIFAQAAINCLIKLQALHGGNSLIGRTLFPLLLKNKFTNISVSPRMVYADPGHPEMVEGFTRRTFIAMVEGVKEDAIKHHFISAEDWDRGIADLYKSAGETGVFCYTFFKARANCC